MDIFEEKEEEQKLLLKQYRRQINAARIIMLAMMVMGVVAAVISMSVTAKFGYDNSLRMWLQFGFMGALLSILGLSYVAPFIPLLLLTLFTLFGVVAYSVSTITAIIYSNYAPGISALLSFLVQIAVSVFMIRGTISAWRYQQLKKLMNK